MSSALGELRRRVRKNLNQSTPPSDTTQQWQNTDLNDDITDTIDEMYPEFAIHDTISAGFLTVSGQYVYPISSTNFVNLTNIELWNSGNNTYLYQEKNWEVRDISGAKNIVFNYLPYDNNYVMRLVGLKRIPFLSADGISSECTREVENVIVLGATTKAIRTMLVDRIQANRYITRLQQEGGKTLDIVRAARDFQDQLDEQKRRLGIPGGNALTFIGEE